MFCASPAPHLFSLFHMSGAEYRQSIGRVSKELVMPQDQSGSDEPTPQRSSGFLEDPQSRRLFLKAAVISGAAVAAVGAAGAAAASASPQILRQLRGQPATVSGQDPTSMCFENTEYEQIDHFDVKNGHASPPQYFIWFTVHSLP